MDPPRLTFRIIQFLKNYLIKMTSTHQCLPTVTEQEIALNDPWIDGTFRVQENRWGTWSSFDKEENKLVMSLTKDMCIDATRFYMKGKQDGFSSEDPSYSGVVDGKL